MKPYDRRAFVILISQRLCLLCCIVASVFDEALTEFEMETTVNIFFNENKAQQGAVYDEISRALFETKLSSRVQTVNPGSENIKRVAFLRQTSRSLIVLKLASVPLRESNNFIANLISLFPVSRNTNIVLIRNSCSLLFPDLMFTLPFEIFVYYTIKNCKNLNYLKVSSEFNGSEPLLVKLNKRLQSNYPLTSPFENIQQSQTCVQVCYSHPTFPRCLLKNSHNIRLNEGCNTQDYAIHLLQYYLNFSTLPCWTKMISNGLILTRHGFRKIQSAVFDRTLKSLKSELVEYERGSMKLIYCSLKQQRNKHTSISALFFPLETSVWILLLFSILFISMLYTLIDTNVSAKDQSRILCTFSFWFFILSSTLLKNREKKFKLVLLTSVVGIVICSYYENELASILIVPEKDHTFASVAELFENKYKVTMPLPDYLLVDSLFSKKAVTEIKRREIELYSPKLKNSQKLQFLDPSKLVVEISDFGNFNASMKSKFEAMVYSNSSFKLALPAEGEDISIETKRSLLDFKIRVLYGGRGNQHECHIVKEPVQTYNMYFVAANLIQYNMSKMFQNFIEFGLFNHWRSRNMWALNFPMAQLRLDQAAFIYKFASLVIEDDLDFVTFKNIVPAFLVIWLLFDWNFSVCISMPFETV